MTTSAANRDCCWPSSTGGRTRCAPCYWPKWRSADSPRGQLEAVWDRVAGDPEDQSGRWALLEHELWLRAARDPDVAEVMRERNAEARRFSARQLAGWSAEVGARPTAEPEELAVLVTALLAGLAMQRRLEPDVVSAEVAVRGTVRPGRPRPGRLPPLHRSYR